MNSRAQVLSESPQEGGRRRGGLGANGLDYASDVEVYSGTGTTWTVIGGPADPNLAAGG